MLGDYGIEQNYGDAAIWLRKAADQGNAMAQNTLGVMYERGLGVTKDLTQAAGLFRKAARQDHHRAQVNLGRMYETAQGGLEGDFMKAYFYYTLAASAEEEQGMKAKASLELENKIRPAEILEARRLAQDYLNGKGRPDFAR